jgi:hypothetical protein
MPDAIAETIRVFRRDLLGITLTDHSVVLKLRTINNSRCRYRVVKDLREVWRQRGDFLPLSHPDHIGKDTAWWFADDAITGSTDGYIGVFIEFI